MTSLRLGVVEIDKPVRLSIRLAPQTHRDVIAYAAALSKETGQPALDPEKLIPVMVEHFMASDRGFAKARRDIPAPAKPSQKPP